MNLGENIKTIRKEKGLTQVQLAKLANISRSYLADVEGNRYNPSIDTLTNIASALNIELKLLLSSDKEKIIYRVEKHSPEIETIAEHLEGKEITPKKIKMIKSYIDALFDDEE